MRLADVLRNHEARFSFYLGARTNNLDSTSARKRRWFHYVHVAVAVDFTVCHKLTVVVRKNIGFGAKVKLCISFAHALHIFPHQVFPADLVRLRKVIYFLIFGRIAQVVVSCYSGPHNVPPRGPWTYDPHT